MGERQCPQSACSGVPPSKEGVDGSGPSEGSAKSPAHVGFYSFRMACSGSHVRWVCSRLWSFRVQNAPRAWPSFTELSSRPMRSSTYDSKSSLLAPLTIGDRLPVETRPRRRTAMARRDRRAQPDQLRRTVSGRQPPGSRGFRVSPATGAASPFSVAPRRGPGKARPVATGSPPSDRCRRARGERYLGGAILVARCRSKPPRPATASSTS